jgi:hypothetical protein
MTAEMISVRSYAMYAQSPCQSPCSIQILVHTPYMYYPETPHIDKPIVELDDLPYPALFGAALSDCFH